MCLVTAVSGDIPQPGPGPAAVPRTRLTAVERRAGILAAARAEFSRSGFHGASTARIAQSAGCSEPMLYKHFAGKLALFTAVLIQVSETMEASIDRVLEGEDPIRAWVEFL